MNFFSAFLSICCPGASDRLQTVVDQQSLHTRQEMLADKLATLERRTVSVERELALLRAQYEKKGDWDIDSQRQDNYLPSLVKLFNS
jgi:hypothetical protein